MSAIAITPEYENRELSALTASELVKIEFDLLGLGTGITCNSLRASDHARCLIRLEQELDKIPPQSKAAYLQAQVHCPALVSDERKLVFLERDDGDATAAASRLVDYWASRFKIFGPDRCFLPMTLDGAMKGMARDLIQHRSMALLPVKDAAGRAIIVFYPDRRNFDEFSPEHEAMAFWYLIEAALEDPDVQEQGVVFVVSGRGVERRHYNLYHMRIMASVGICIPYHVRAVHLCHPSAIGYYVIFPVLKTFVGKHVRLRFKIHKGSDDEIVGILGGFCLPKECIPTDLGGDLVVDMEAFVAERLRKERVDKCQNKGSSAASESVSLSATASASSPAAASAHINDSLAKRPRVEHNEMPDRLDTLCPSISLSSQEPTATRDTTATMTTTTTNNKKRKSTSSKKRGSGRGRIGDPRMEKSMKIRLANPKMPLRDVLVMGGFVFNSVDGTGEEVDEDGIRLDQRRNQLSRRIRLLKIASKG